jgi:hypothetical protein
MENFTMQPARIIAKRIALIAIVMLLTSCSIVRLGYNHGETIAYWWLDGYVDFNAQQKAWFKERLANWFAWHRKTQLKDYVSLLEQEQKRLRHPVTAAELLAEYEKIHARIVVMVDKALPDFADLALSLQPSQIEHIQKKFASANETYRKDYLSGDAAHRQAFRFKKVMEQAEYWFGSFSPEQEVLIRKASDVRPLNNELRMAVRLQLQQDLIRILKNIQSEKPSREAAESMLKEYLNNMIDHYGGSENKAFFDASRDGMANLVMVIINCATPEQKEHAIKRLQQWIDNFDVLAGQTN